MRSFFRIIKFATQSTLRNFWLSFVTTSVFLLTLITVNAVVSLNVLADATVQSVEDKVKVDVYFKQGTSEEIVKSVRGYLLGLDQVKTVDVIPQEEALELFRDRHADDALILAALDEVNGNPLGDALRVSAKESEHFEFILQALDSPEYSPYIRDKEYQDYTTAIDNLNNFAAKVRIAGLVLAGFFALIAILIVFNTIRVAIYVHREEIGIMKLVGANDWFVRGPFLFEALMYSATATVLMAAILAVVFFMSESYINNFFEGVDVSLIEYYQSNAVVIFGSQFAVLLLLGLITTWFAMRKYLRV